MSPEESQLLKALFDRTKAASATRATARRKY